jgi:hypothetical protein
MFKEVHIRKSKGQTIIFLLNSNFQGRKQMTSFEKRKPYHYEIVPAYGLYLKVEMKGRIGSIKVPNNRAHPDAQHVKYIYMVIDF